jgi:hypothetical protein
VVAFLACCFAGCGDGDAPERNEGRRLAEQYCQGCHIFPEPELLERESWERWVLPRMARMLGVQLTTGWVDQEPIEYGEGGRLVTEAAVFPDTAQVSAAEWSRIAAYYMENAPLELPPPPAREPIATGLPGFLVHVPEFRIPSPMVTLIRLDPARGRIYVGDGTPGRSTLNVLDARGGVIETRSIHSAPSHLRLTGDTISLLQMGMLHPSDAPLGSLSVLGPAGRGAEPETLWRLEGLRRPVHASYADLSGDGIDDVVISEFGHLTGRLAWYERLPDGGSRQHTIVSVPGSLNTFVGDFDGDGRLDVIALTAQGDEGVSLFRRLPDGGFSRQWLLRFPPSWGSTSMELVDVNGDGHLDIVHTAGDAGDYPARPRPYHGIRIFLNDGRWRFEERYFFPMHGAFRALARDFDGDGDLDIAAIAFYPDYTSDTPESFVYLENLGGWRFRPSTFAGAERGRWLTMDAADVDGDGDLDLVLGSFAQLDALGDEHGHALRWREPDAPTIVILENTRGGNAGER